MIQLYTITLQCFLHPEDILHLECTTINGSKE